MIYLSAPPPLSFYPSLFYIMYIFVLFPSSLPALPFSSFSFHLLHHATQSRLLFSTPALSPLQWRHKGHDGVSSYQRLDCLINRLFRRKSKETSKLRVTGLCEVVHRGPVNSPHKGPVTRKMTLPCISSTVVNSMLFDKYVTIRTKTRDALAKLVKHTSW